MSKDIKKSEEAAKEVPAAAPEAKVEAAPAAVVAEAAVAAPVAESPKAEPAAPKLSAGLFQGFTLGSTLKPGAVGNVMSNMKKPMMDYEKQFANSTKNQKMTSEELQKLSQKK